jgi:hypothetical protein
LSPPLNGYEVHGGQAGGDAAARVQAVAAAAAKPVAAPNKGGLTKLDGAMIGVAVIAALGLTFTGLVYFKAGWEFNKMPNLAWQVASGVAGAMTPGAMALGARIYRVHHLATRNLGTVAEEAGGAEEPQMSYLAKLKAIKEKKDAAATAAADAFVEETLAAVHAEVEAEVKGKSHAEALDMRARLTKEAGERSDKKPRVDLLGEKKAELQAELAEIENEEKLALETERAEVHTANRTGLIDEIDVSKIVVCDFDEEEKAEKKKAIVTALLDEMIGKAVMAKIEKAAAEAADLASSANAARLAKAVRTMQETTNVREAMKAAKETGASLTKRLTAGWSAWKRKRK